MTQEVLIPEDLKDGHVYLLPMRAIRGEECDNDGCPCAGVVLIPVTDVPLSDEHHPCQFFHVTKDNEIVPLVKEPETGRWAYMTGCAFTIDQLVEVQVDE